MGHLLQICEFFYIVRRILFNGGWAIQETLKLSCFIMIIILDEEDIKMKTILSFLLTISCRFLNYFYYIRGNSFL